MEHICKDKSYLVAGMGKSGVSSTNLLSHFGAKVVLYDDNESVDLEAVMSRLNKTAQVEFYCKYIPEHELEKIEEVVLSPGIPTDAVYVDEWRNYGWSILGEIELAYRYEQGDIIAITGTNGKTTTTALVGEIMREQWEQVFVAGNIGMPYTETVTKTTPKSCTVLEVSSFQLETIQKFHPKVSAVLNITPDHLNRHHTMEKYAKAKLDVTMNQGSDDYVILNYEDDILREASKKMEPKVIFFSSKHELEEGVFLRNKDEIIVKLGGKEISFCKTSELLLLGIHSYENVMAAIAMTWMMGVEPSKIYHAITHFKSVEHRIEYVCERNGVTYYNDSKGTNTDAAIKGIQSMVRPTFLIGGGYNKDADFTEWIQSFEGKVKKLVLIGETKEMIADTCKKVGFDDYVLMDTFQEAVFYCIEQATEGDAVLLSPACASWDMFRSYEERGNIFKKYVLE